MQSVVCITCPAPADMWVFSLIAEFGKLVRAIDTDMGAMVLQRVGAIEMHESEGGQ